MSGDGIRAYAGEFLTSPAGLELSMNWCGHAVQSVMKVSPGTLVLMPWQDAAANIRRPFVAGFDD